MSRAPIGGDPLRNPRPSRTIAPTAHGTRVGTSHLVAQAPQIGQAPVVGAIWILFGDLRGFEEHEKLMREVYKKRQKEINEPSVLDVLLDRPTHRLVCGLPTGTTTKQALLTYLSDPGTLALAWHSHGIRRNGSATGEVACANQEILGPGEIKTVSPNLAFAAFIGCEVRANAAMEKAWIGALKLDRFQDAARRFTASGEGVRLWDQWTLTGRTVSGYGRDFAEGTASRFDQFKLSDWIEQLRG